MATSNLSLIAKPEKRVGGAVNSCVDMLLKDGLSDINEIIILTTRDGVIEYYHNNLTKAEINFVLDRTKAALCKHALNPESA